MDGFNKRVSSVVTELKAPKNLYNSFGKYKYRNAEGICEAAKPLLYKYGLLLRIQDEVIQIGERYYIKSTCILSDTESDESITCSAMARESDDKKGMDAAQVTGATSSYARKYALNGLFLLDDTKDADSDEYKQETDAKNEEQNFNKKVEFVKVLHISKPKASALKSKCTKEGVSIDKLCGVYKVATVEDLTESQYENIFKFWDKVKESCKE